MLMYTKRRCQYSGCFQEFNNLHGSYGGVKLTGLLVPMAKIEIGQLAPTSRRGRKKILDGGVRAPREVLQAYMGKVVWPHPPDVERQGLYGH